MTILLTGATGFIGQHILKALSAYDVIPISRSKKPGFYQVDIFDEFSIKQCITDIHPSILIHLAWDVTHGKFWQSPLNTNYKKATLTLFDICAQNGVEHMIATGTCAEYVPSVNPVSEEDSVDINLLTPYGRAKRESCDYLKMKGYPHTWFRIFGITGDGENPERFFPKARLSVQNGIRFIIEKPDIYHDYIDVKTFSDIVVQAVNSGPWGVVNVGSGEAKSMQAWYNQITGDHSTSIESSPSALSRIPDCRKIHLLYTGQH